MVLKITQMTFNPFADVNKQNIFILLVILFLIISYYYMLFDN